MPLITVSVTVSVNGTPIATAPFTYSFQASEYTEVAYSKATGDGTSYFSFGRLITQNGFLINTDATVLLGFLGQATGLQLNPGGTLLLLGGTLSAGSSNNLLVNNNSGATAHIQGWEFGP